MNLKQILAVFCLMCLPLAPLSAQNAVRDTLGGSSRAMAGSPAELLKGELSGVRVSSIDGNPNGALNVNIRGLNTLRGDSQPLWIVDGAVVGSSVNNNLNAFYMGGGLTSNGEPLPDYSGRAYASPLNNFGWLSPCEIESIEVVKDMSAAAIYGMQGANGVIIVKTRRARENRNSVLLSTNVGVDVPSQRGDAFATGIVHMHDLCINGMAGNNSYYNISGFIRQNNASVRHSDALSGGLGVNLETMANDIFQFGFNSYLSYGDYTSAAGTNFIGAPSTMMLSRRPEAFADDTVRGWVDSYDDTAIDYRTVNSLWLNIRFMKVLSLKLSGGIDYQNQTRYFWYGPGTSFGKEYSGAAGILGNSLFNYNFKGELNYNMNVAVHHRIYANLAFDINGNVNKTNAMCGTDYFLPYLRAKGLSLAGSLNQIRKFSRKYNEMGAYLQLGYDFDGRAGVNGVVRGDYNSRFDKEPVLFASGEAYVDIMKVLERTDGALSSLRVSGGWGAAGRETVLPYAHLSSWIAGVPEAAAGAETYIDGMNRLLSKEWNAGIRAAFAGGRFNVALKYYDKSTDDTFSICNYGKVVSDLWVKTSKWSIVQERTSSVRNNGFELDADLGIISSRRVRWSLYGNAAWNINSIVTLDDLDAAAPDRANGLYVISNTKGESVASAFGYNTLPTVSGGFGTTLSLYGFTLEAGFSGAAGFSIINGENLIEKGLEALSEDDLERGDYIRFDRLSLSYDIPLRAKWIRSLTVDLSARNLCTFTKYGGWNPDVNSFGVTVRSNGVDYGSFPVRRLIVLGASIKF